ncbi:Gmad2 immunoglobulin-like domain-containing protein [Nocardioides sp. CF8]|uniref:Gmad2 immunoglobulin-like domain-containing protein n=1 Tax=Nocardioides sp. CF8 TaxID=110319 RepID=UPI0003FA4CAA|nr:Gmad2 immunoglobulin-like domain-containing protein [Nocardioides sp. CF8]
MTSPSRRLAALLSLGALALGATACSEEVPDRDTSPAAETATETPTDSPTDSPTSDPGEAGETGAAAGETVVPVYFVGDTPQGPRLFREFRAVPADNPLMEATALMLAGDSLDPDYRTLWPQVEVSSVGATDGVLLVQIPGDGFTARPDGMSRKAAKLALQQLVFTIQGVQQERVPVVVKRGGTDFRLFGLSTEQEFTNAAPLDVMGLVNITTPEQGAVVTGDTLEASGVGSSFEATMPWEIRRGDEVVLDGFATAEGWMDKLYPWETSIDVSGLEPGDYTFVARTDDPSGGAEGSGPHEDTKDFTIE